MAVEIGIGAAGFEAVAKYVADNGGLSVEQADGVRVLLMDRYAFARRLQNLEAGDVGEFKGRRFIVLRAAIDGVVCEFEDGNRRTLPNETFKLDNTVLLGKGEVVRKIHLVNREG